MESGTFCLSMTEVGIFVIKELRWVRNQLSPSRQSLGQVY